MPRLREQLYSTKDGKKLNCYNLSITRAAASAAGFTPEDVLCIEASEGKIVVMRACNNCVAPLSEATTEKAC